MTFYGQPLGLLHSRKRLFGALVEPSTFYGPQSGAGVSSPFPEYNPPMPAKPKLSVAQIEKGAQFSDLSFDFPHLNFADAAAKAGW